MPDGDQERVPAPLFPTRRSTFQLTHFTSLAFGVTENLKLDREEPQPPFMKDLFLGLCRQEAMAILIHKLIQITVVSALVWGGSGTPSEEPVLQRQDAHRDCARSCCARRRHAIVVTCQLMTPRTSGIEGRVLVGRAPRHRRRAWATWGNCRAERAAAATAICMSTVQSTTSTQARRIHMWLRFFSQ